MAGPQRVGATTLAGLTGTGGAALLCPAGESGLARIAAGWTDHVDLVQVTSIDHQGLASVLIPPDGVAAWAAPVAGQADLTAAEDALRTWFGGQS